MDQANDLPSEPKFRANKRRKIYRRRADEENDGHTALVAPNATNDAPEASVVSLHDADDEAAAKATRRADMPIPKRSAPSRRGGVGFSSSHAQRPVRAEYEGDNLALVPTDTSTGAVDFASSRFMAPTGQAVVKDDKHMMAYIDSKMAELRSERAAQAQAQADHPQDSALIEPATAGPSQDRTSTRDQVHGLRQGELEEIELDQQHQTIRTTTKAKRQRPPRLGRDGKPLPPRKPRYGVRTSEDVARDTLVEQLLSESRLENIYSPAAQSALNTAGVAPGADEAADERLAEEFRREFLASAEEKNNARRAAPAMPGAGGIAGAKGDPTKGPKMGGSRQQRAAMVKAVEEKARKK